MKHLSNFFFSTLFLLASFAKADGTVLIVCKTGGGRVAVLAGESKNMVNLAFDQNLQAALGGPQELQYVPAIMEARDSGSTTGPIELIEIGSYKSDDTKIGIGLLLNTQNQHLGQSRDIALTPSESYNRISSSVMHRSFVVSSCALGADLPSVSALRNFINIEVGD